MPAPLPLDFFHAVLAPRCLGCRRSLPSGSHAYCFSCLRVFLGAPSPTGALFSHGGPVKGFLHALRGSAPPRSAVLALALLKRKRHLARWQGAGIELVMHAPQNQRRQWSGLALIAKAVAEELGALFVPRAFRKQNARSQHGRSLTSRMDSPCFVELARPEAWVRGRHVLVLDDVNTTGTTLDLCAFVLRRAGAARVSTFALAQRMATFSAESEAFQNKIEGIDQ